MHAAFVASTSLKPMARQLLQDRTPAAYAGVEAYARRHTQEDAGALAWLVLGYAHILDKDYAKAVDPLNRAKPQAGDLGDYVNFYLGTAYFQSGRTAEAVTTLADFEKQYPESLLLRDARVLYGSALLAENRAKDAIAVLEKDRQPPRADLELALGRAYARPEQPAKAAEILRNLYVTMPLSAEASQADVELKQAGFDHPVAARGPERAQNARRSAGQRANDSAMPRTNIAICSAWSSPSDRPEIQMALAVALRRSGQRQGSEEDSGCAGQLAGPKSIRNGFSTWERLLVAATTRMASCATWDNCVRRSHQFLAATGAAFGRAIIYLLKPDYDKAIDAYRELQQRFPNAGRASYAHWKVAWLSLRQGRTAEAKTGFEQQIGLYPTSAEVPAALYWRARLAEEDKDPAMARAYYQKLSERFRNFYYGELARRRLREIKADDDPPAITLCWTAFPPINAGTNITASRPAHRQPALSEGASAGERRAGGFCGARTAGRRQPKTEGTG